MIRITEKTKDGYRCVLHPSGTETDFSVRELARFVFENDGIYFSYGAN